MRAAIRWATALAIGVLGAPAVQAQDEARLLRFPAIHGDKIVFGYAGNLYLVSADGGVARRLTSHEGYEMFPRFSPDGKRIAFTAQYDGNTEVYVMPAEGGVPKRLTYTATLGRDDVSDRMGPNNIVMTWKNDREIVFRSRMREFNDFIGQLYSVNLDGNPPEQIPVPRGGFCSFSPDGKKMAYNRVFREFRTWKRYRGGMADDVWIHDLEAKTTLPIAVDPACDVFPMWHGDSIYFLSDRNEAKRFNLYRYDLANQGLRQLTNFTEWDIKYPSLGDSAIVFENAGFVYRYDLKSGVAKQVPIRILDDRLGSRGGLVDVSKSVGAFEISPDGKRALFGARGDLFTVPAKDGVTRNLTKSSGVHDRNPKWSPDGKSVAYVSDASGEDEIHVVPADGSGPSVQLTAGGPPYKYAIHWSPDSKKLLWADKKMRLFVLDVASKTITQIAQAEAWEIHDYVWSPDSKWVAYARPELNGMTRIYLHSLANGKSTAVTDGWFDSYKPAFSGDGKYLFFASEREFNPIYSATEWNHAYADMAKLYLVTLAKATPNPFAPKGDDEAKKPEPKKDEKKDEAKKDEPKKDLVVDLDGLGDRILALGTPAGSYNQLQSVGSSLYYVRGAMKAPGGFYVYDVAAKKETSLGTVGGYEISANGQKMLVAKDGTYGIVDLPKGTFTWENLNLSGLQVKLDREQEWRQIFDESWRQMRDFFYDPGLHGVDWKAIRERYRPLVAHVGHRADLTYVIGEMISELNAGHAYVGGGEMPKVAKIPMGLLGADFKYDPKDKSTRIVRILQGDPGERGVRSPLAELGVDVRAGDYLIAINGQPTRAMANFQEALVATVGKQVRLSVSQTPDGAGARDVTIVPIGDEASLRYRDWVRANQRKVDEATKGEVGYLHVPDMLQSGLNEFARHFYPQLRKKALVIDMRGNGGGNVSPQLIERLRREMAMVKMSRDTAPAPNPGETFLGPMVCLMNEFSASDGDIFPFRFKHYKLGKLIGKRSWGGTIGIRGSLPFLDGGSLNKPEFASYDVEGKRWVIEGYGVDPDIVVDNDPGREFAGVDDQLNRAIETILEELRARPRGLPPIPPFPKR